VPIILTASKKELVRNEIESILKLDEIKYLKVKYEMNQPS
jgi:hypothetical protein